MDEQRRREISAKGGRSAHQQGSAHEFTSSEARAAGHKGGESVSQDREHMATIGKKGGETHGLHVREARQTEADVEAPDGTKE